MKKIIFIFICLIMPSLSQAYVDINSDHWAYEDIIELKNRNIVSGYPDDTFRPDNYITEEELITIIFNVANIKMSENLKNWPDDYIKLAGNNNLNVTQEFATRKKLLELTQKVKNMENIKCFDNEFTNRLSLLINFVNERELIDLDKNITRADVCVFINNLINMSKTKLPIELSKQNESSLDIKTIINFIEISKFNSYDGVYKDIINKIKEGGHPYLDFRKNLAEDNCLLVIDFETINNSEYEVPTSYDHLKLDFMQEGIAIIDSFDIDEVNAQILNQPYNGVFVKNRYNTIAFYVLNEIPQNLEINRDINTLYDEHTNEYINVNLLNSAKINF